MSATSGGEEPGLAQLVRLSRQSLSSSVAKVEPATVVTLQIRVTRPLSTPVPTSRLVHFEAPTRSAQGRRNGSLPARRPRNVRVASMALGLVSMLFLASFAGVGAYRLWARPAHHVAAVQAAVLPHVDLHAVLLSTSSSAVTYQVPVATFTIAVKVIHPCWLVVKSPPDAVSFQVATTLLPSSSPMVIPISGAASVTFAARAVSVTILSGSTVLGVIDDPALGPAYTFVSAKT